jgi:phosphotransferase system enzyme I (PtsI)
MTIDGHAIELQANIELPGDLSQALDNGATGVGLVPLGVPVPAIARVCRPRTSSSRRIERWLPAWKASPVTIRTFDLGAGQAQGGPGRPCPRGAESALGPARGALLSRRAATLPHAASCDPARVALRPGEDTRADALVTGEIDQTLGMIAQAKETLRERRVPFDPPSRVGGMIEFPPPCWRSRLPRESSISCRSARTI